MCVTLAARWRAAGAPLAPTELQAIDVSDASDPRYTENIESASGVDSACPDFLETYSDFDVVQSLVQSTPAGAFLQGAPTALASDTAADGVAVKAATSEMEVPQLARAEPIEAPILPPPPVSPSCVAPLEIGTEVEIDGLKKQPLFNGLAGIVQSWDPLMRRYEVLLHAMPDGSGKRLVKLKRENFRPRPPPPPESAAAVTGKTISLDSCIPASDEIASTLACGAASLAWEAQASWDDGASCGVENVLPVHAWPEAADCGIEDIRFGSLEEDSQVHLGSVEPYKGNQPYAAAQANWDDGCYTAGKGPEPESFDSMLWHPHFAQNAGLA